MIFDDQELLRCAFYKVDDTSGHKQLAAYVDVSS
jgi:hypothetical protein